MHVETDHVTCCHEPEVPPERVHPDIILVLGVADADVARLALCESLAREVAEGGSRVDEDVFAVFSVGGEGWDAWCWDQYEGLRRALVVYEHKYGKFLTVHENSMAYGL